MNEERAVVDQIDRWRHEADGAGVRAEVQRGVGGQFRMVGGMVSPTSISRASAQTAPTTR